MALAGGVNLTIAPEGTVEILGEPTEANAIETMPGTDRAPEHPLLPGSPKTNIGHLEAAAGIAGPTKTVLVIKNQMIPPNLHFERPNPHVSFDLLRLCVPREPELWPFPGKVPLAGVSVFGLDETNCHCALTGLTPQPAHLLLLPALADVALSEDVTRARHVVEPMKDTLPKRHAPQDTTAREPVVNRVCFHHPDIVTTFDETCAS